MRFEALVLLAVHLNLIAAGLIREPRLSVRYVSRMAVVAKLTEPRSRLNLRHDNHSSIADTTPSEYSITSPIALKAAQTSGADGQIESTAPAKGQFGSVPAFGSGPGAATTEEAKSQTATTKVNPYPTSAPSVKGYHDEDYNYESIAATSQSKAALPLSNGALTAIQSAIQSVATPAKTEQPVGTASAKASPSTASIEALKGKKGNIAMAMAFNSVFAKMNAQSPCNAKNKDEVVACISGQFGQCSNGKYTLIQCPQGQSCFALPLSGSTQGITVQCASKQDANQRLGTAPAAASLSQSASLVSQLPSAAKSTIASAPSIAQSPTAASGQPYQSMSASHTHQTSAAKSNAAQATGVIQSLPAGSAQASPTQQQSTQPTQPLATQSSQGTISNTTSVSSQPTATRSSQGTISTSISVSSQPSTTQSSQPTQSTSTSVSSQPAAASTESTATQSKPSATPTTPEDTQSASSTPTTTPSPSVSSAPSSKPSATSTSDDGQITVIPIP